VIIHSMSLRNFRQFESEQSLEFGFDPEKRITLIEGENGSGKTTLLRALRWGLFGGRDQMTFDTPFTGVELLPDGGAERWLEGAKRRVSVSIEGTQGTGKVCITRSQEFHFNGIEAGSRRENPERVLVSLDTNPVEESTSILLRRISRLMRTGGRLPDTLEGLDLGPGCRAQQIWNDRGDLPLAIDSPFGCLDRNRRSSAIRQLQFLQRQIVVFAVPMIADEIANSLDIVGRRWKIVSETFHEKGQRSRLVEVSVR
jgi:energy-coupling factor transporter ATP-binding protein EcfA2